ncbi:unnamed protein product, partial [Pleuronectes platessa]
KKAGEVFCPEAAEILRPEKEAAGTQEINSLTLHLLLLVTDELLTRVRVERLSPGTRL